MESLHGVCSKVLEHSIKQYFDTLIAIFELVFIDMKTFKTIELESILTTYLFKFFIVYGKKEKNTLYLFSNITFVYALIHVGSYLYKNRLTKTYYNV